VKILNFYSVIWIPFTFIF